MGIGTLANAFLIVLKEKQSKSSTLNSSCRFFFHEARPHASFPVKMHYGVPMGILRVG